MNINTLNCVIEVQLQQQNDNKKLRLIMCYLRAIISAEQNYNIYNKELLVIVTTLKK